MEYPRLPSTGSNFVDAQFTFVELNNSVHMRSFLANIPDRKDSLLYSPNASFVRAFCSTASHRSSILNFLNIFMDTDSLKAAVVWHRCLKAQAANACGHKQWKLAKVFKSIWNGQRILRCLTKFRNVQLCLVCAVPISQKTISKTLFLLTNICVVEHSMFVAFSQFIECMTRSLERNSAVL